MVHIRMFCSARRVSFVSNWRHKRNTSGRTKYIWICTPPRPYLIKRLVTAMWFAVLSWIQPVSAWRKDIKFRVQNYCTSFNVIKSARISYGVCYYTHLQKMLFYHNVEAMKSHFLTLRRKKKQIDAGERKAVLQQERRRQRVADVSKWSLNIFTGHFLLFST